MPGIRPQPLSIRRWMLFPAVSALAIGLMLAGCSSEQADQPTQVAPTQPMAVETPPPEEPIDPVYRIAELAVDAGIPDLGRNIDHYLYGHPRAGDAGE